MDKKLSVFNYARNRDKLLANLINMIDGVLCDGILDEKELLYLDTWLLESEIINKNYCIQYIRSKISLILSDGVIEQSELEQFKKDLVDIQSQLLDFPNIDLYSEESDKHLLEGLCKGVIANGQLNDKEIKYLHWWLSQNGMLKNNFPGKDLYKLIESILADGVITQEERESLKSALIAFTGCDLESGAVDGLSTRLPVDGIDALDLKGAKVCLTGKFLYGERSACKAAIEKSGGIVTDGITKALDYLIIGVFSSRDWRYQSYGRKIEKAVEYREAGNKLKIITEEQWQELTA